MFVINYNTAVKTNDLELYVCMYLYVSTGKNTMLANCSTP